MHDIGVAFEVAVVGYKFSTIGDSFAFQILATLIHTEHGIVHIQEEVWLPTPSDVEVEQLLPARTQGCLHDHMHVLKVRVGPKEKLDSSCAKL